MNSTAKDQYQSALPHGAFEEVFPRRLFSSAVLWETVLQGMDWEFSRNMTVVRDGETLDHHQQCAFWTKRV